jgi:thiol-disulfide isomerase/thioredoxin
MNKAILGVLVAVVAIGGITLTMNSSTPSAAAQVLASNGNFTYETFTEARYNQLRGTEAFAVFFHSKTCGTCAKMNQEIIDEVSKFTNGRILKAEFSEMSSTMLKELGVAKYHTTVVFDENGEFTTLKGAMPDAVRNQLDGTQAAAPSVVEKVISAIVPRVLAASGEFTYEEFSMARYNELLGNEKFAVFFHSKTCGTCAKKHKQTIDEVSQFSAGTFLRAEFGDIQTEYPELLQKLGVAKYDTMVVFNADGTFETLKGGTVEDVRNAI